ncbi:MAG: hypothetical protein V7772_06050 [Pseudomonas profundi]
MKRTKIEATYEEAERLKAENRSKKIARLASLSKAERSQLEEQLRDVVVNDFGGCQRDT